MFGLIIYLMYNTIENPDLKLIAQLELAKQSAEKANNAKSDFLSSSFLIISNIPILYLVVCCLFLNFIV